MKFIGNYLDEHASFAVALFISITALLLRHLLMKQVAKTAEKNKAFCGFRDSFLPCLSALESMESKEIDTRKLLLESYSMHNEAVLRLKQYLNYFEKQNLETAWQEFSSVQSFDTTKFGLNGTDRIHIKYLAISDDEEELVRVLAIKNIRKLLSLARPR